MQVGIHYWAIFDDPVPVRPINTDNPGFGVNVTISQKGSFLLAGAGWYPELVGSTATYRVTVTAPSGQIAVTAGRSLGHRTENGKTVSAWEVKYPVEGLPFPSPGMRLKKKRSGEVTVATYLLPPNRQLAASYLEATTGYLSLYSDFFGAYPFQKFAVVENFSPCILVFLPIPYWAETCCGCRLSFAPAWAMKSRTAGGETGFMWITPRATGVRASPLCGGLSVQRDEIPRSRPGSQTTMAAKLFNPGCTEKRFCAGPLSKPI